MAVLSAYPAATVSTAPTIVVDRLHVVYRVVGRHARAGAPAALRRMVLRQAPPGLREIHALRGVSFTVRRGEAVGVLGANGSGKSTLLRTIAGLIPPRSGAVYVDGRPALLDVAGALMKDLTGSQNIVLGALASGMSREQVRERYPWIVEFAGLGEFLGLPMSTYSSGMAARLRFAIAAAQTHKVLLIDEALAAGDAEFRRRSEARIRELREAAGTVVIVSHSAATIRQTCDRAIWLDHGRTAANGAAGTVVAAYEEQAGRPTGTMEAAKELARPRGEPPTG